MQNLQSILGKLETKKHEILATLEQQKRFVLLEATVPHGQLFADLQAVEWSIELVQAQIESESV
jgi:hypothetical protein